MVTLNNLLRGLRDLIYPKTCLACKKKIVTAAIDELVCLDCWAKIKKNTPPFCRRCGRPLRSARMPEGICRECIKKPFRFDRAFSPCTYDGVTKELLHEFKYKGKDYLGFTLSRLLVEFIKEYSLPMDIIDWVIPIPLHAARMREREFNQSQVLSTHIAHVFNRRLLHGVLVRHRHTKPQAELAGNERLSNVKGIFSLKERKSIEGKNVLLIDDVLTTGATTSEAAGTLKDAGAHIVFVLTIAN